LGTKPIFALPVGCLSSRVDGLYEAHVGTFIPLLQLVFVDQGRSRSSLHRRW
jgi:hypothetical protein